MPPTDVNRALNFGGGGQGSCERRNEVFVKFQCFLFVFLCVFFFLGGGAGGQVRGRGSG